MGPQAGRRIGCPAARSLRPDPEGRSAAPLPGGGRPGPWPRGRRRPTVPTGGPAGRQPGAGEGRYGRKALEAPPQAAPLAVVPGDLRGGRLHGDQGKPSGGDPEPLPDGNVERRMAILHGDLLPEPDRPAGQRRALDRPHLEEPRPIAVRDPAGRRATPTSGRGGAGALPPGAGPTGRHPGHAHEDQRHEERPRQGRPPRWERPAPTPPRLIASRRPVPRSIGWHRDGTPPPGPSPRSPGSASRPRGGRPPVRPCVRTAS